MSAPRTEGFWRERARGVGLVLTLGLATLAVGAAIAWTALMAVGG